MNLEQARGCKCQNTNATQRKDHIIHQYKDIFFFWYRVSEAYAPTDPGGAQAHSKEFPASAPRVIQGAIKFPQWPHIGYIVLTF